MSVQAMKAGAVDFLPSPSATRTCSTPCTRRSHATATRAQQAERTALRRRFEALTRGSGT